MFRSRFAGGCILAIVLASFAASVIIYPTLPQTFISHWSLAGTPNGTMGKLWGAFLLPVMMLVFVFVWWILPRIDPIAPGFPRFRYAYDFLWVLVIAFLAYVQALVLGANVGLAIDWQRELLPAIGVLFAAIGSLLPLTKRNWFFGIRTPWTLSSEAVWDKTHRLGGVLFVIAGIVMFVSAFFRLPFVLTLIVPIVVAALIPVVYSYFLYRAEHKSND